MGRQIIEVRETEESAFDKIDEEIVMNMHYETFNMSDRRAFELIEIEGKSQETTAIIIGGSASRARDHAVRNKRELKARLDSIGFEL